MRLWTNWADGGEELVKVAGRGPLGAGHPAAPVVRARSDADGRRLIPGQSRRFASGSAWGSSVRFGSSTCAVIDQPGRLWPELATAGAVSHTAF